MPRSMIPRNPAQLPDAWYSTLFASAGALFANVLSALEMEVYGWLTVFVSFVALFCFALLARLRSGAAREEEAGRNNAYEDIRTKAIALFVLGLVLFLGAIALVGWGNHRKSEATTDAARTLNQVLERQEKDAAATSSQILLGQTELHDEIAKQRDAVARLVDVTTALQDMIVNPKRIDAKSDDDSPADSQ